MNYMQKQVDEWVQRNGGYWSPVWIMTRLTEENGELAREISHQFGPKKKKSSEDKKEIREEIGDMLFTLCCMANALEISLDDSFKETMKKYESRDKERFGKK